MKHRNSEEHRIEQRLRRIETQLQDILMALDHQSPERLGDDDQSLLDSALRELQSNRDDIALRLFAMEAANDPDIGEDAGSESESGISRNSDDSPKAGSKSDPEHDL
jgi:uncharacterized protein (DUF885 family)